MYFSPSPPPPLPPSKFSYIQFLVKSSLVFLLHNDFVHIFPADLHNMLWSHFLSLITSNFLWHEQLCILQEIRLVFHCTCQFSPKLLSRNIELLSVKWNIRWCSSSIFSLEMSLSTLSPSYSHLSWSIIFSRHFTALQNPSSHSPSFLRPSSASLLLPVSVFHLRGLPHQSGDPCCLFHPGWGVRQEPACWLIHHAVEWLGGNLAVSLGRLSPNAVFVGLFSLIGLFPPISCLEGAMSLAPEEGNGLWSSPFPSSFSAFLPFWSENWLAAFWLPSTQATKF